MGLKSCCIYLFIIFLIILGKVEARTKIWGPGLYPDKIVMPARYFFVQIDDENDEIDAKVSGVTYTNRQCRIWTQVMQSDQKLFIVRYKLYETCRNLRISITKKDYTKLEDIIINKVIYSEDCYCPVEDIKTWFKDVQCDQQNIPAQIQRDIQSFTSIDMHKMRDVIVKKYDSPSSVSLCHYVIMNNNVYRKCYGKYVGFKMFVDSILLSLCRKVNMPDLELFVNLGDWPLSKNPDWPIFSWCGSNDTFDIVMPTYDLTESTLENMGRITLDMLSIQGNTKIPWVNRTEKCFWRGRDSNRVRLNLIDISREYPELFNVSMTNFFFFRDEQDKYGPKTPHVSFFDFFEYKYQLSIDGTVSAYRFPYLLAGGSTVFKQNSKFYEHFYQDLEPGVHYIPIETDLSNLIDHLNWARENDAEAQKVAKNAKEFANEHLLPKNILCYYVQLFNEYKKKLSSEVTVLEGMEKVEQPEQSENCHCQTLGLRDEL